MSRRMLSFQPAPMVMFTSMELTPCVAFEDERVRVALVPPIQVPSTLR